MEFSMHVLIDTALDADIRPGLPPDSWGVSVFVVDGGGGQEGHVYTNVTASGEGLRNRRRSLNKPRPQLIRGLVFIAEKDGVDRVHACAGDVLPTGLGKLHVCGVLYARDHLAVTPACQADLVQLAEIKAAAAPLLPRH
jgi:hypothetical protein